MKKFLFLTASIFLLNFAAEAVDCPTADTINRAVEDTASFAKFKDAMDNIEGMKFQSFTPTKNLVTDKWSDDIQSFIYGGGQYAPTPFKSTKATETVCEYFAWRNPYTNIFLVLKKL